MAETKQKRKKAAKRKPRTWVRWANAYVKLGSLVLSRYRGDVEIGAPNRSAIRVRITEEPSNG